MTDQFVVLLSVLNDKIQDQARIIEDLEGANARLRTQVNRLPDEWAIDQLRRDLGFYRTEYERKQARLEEVERELRLLKHGPLDKLAEEVYNADPYPLTRAYDGNGKGYLTCVHKIQHIKCLRARSQCGLKEAKDAMEAHYEKVYTPTGGTSYEDWMKVAREVVKAFPGKEQKIAQIKELRSRLGCALIEAKNLVEAVSPATLGDLIKEKLGEKSA